MMRMERKMARYRALPTRRVIVDRCIGKRPGAESAAASVVFFEALSVYGVEMCLWGSGGLS